MTDKEKSPAKKNTRKKTPVATETAVLVKSRRVCAICWALRRDGRAKSGQIAHSNKDRSDAKEANLVWVCLACHDDYDSTKSQAKNITVSELRVYKEAVEKDVIRGLIPNEKGAGSALLDVAIIEAALIGLGEKSRIEIRLCIANQGSKDTGIREIQLEIAGQKAGNLELKHRVGDSARKCTNFRKDAIYLSLESSQMVKSGQMIWCAAHFIPTEVGASLWNQHLEDGLLFETEQKVSLRICPVSGPDSLVSTNRWVYYAKDPSAPSVGFLL